MSVMQGAELATIHSLDRSAGAGLWCADVLTRAFGRCPVRWIAPQLKGYQPAVRIHSALAGESMVFYGLR